MRLRRATSDDIPAIMAIERQPGYEALVGQWSAEQHAEHLGDPGFHYFVANDDDGAVTAFAALHAQPDGLVLNRIIVKEAGRGLGKTMLEAIMALAASLGRSDRIWLRVAAHNERAIRLYHSFGFAEEGRLDCAGTLPDGRIVDLIVMARSIREHATP